MKPHGLHQVSKQWGIYSGVAQNVMAYTTFPLAMSNKNYAAFAVVNNADSPKHALTAYISHKDTYRLKINTGENGQYSVPYPVALFIIGF